MLTYSPYERINFDLITDWKTLNMSSEFSFKPGQLVNDFYTNSHGFLSVELPYENKNKAKRVLYLGDSFLVITPFKYHFITRIENELRKAMPGERIESINLGISSVGTSVYQKALEVEGARFNPDIIVVSFFVGNDFTDDDLNRDRINTVLHPEMSGLRKFMYSSKLVSFLLNSYIYYSSGLFINTAQNSSSSVLGAYNRSFDMKQYDPFAPLLSSDEYQDIETSRFPILIPNSSAYTSVPIIQKNLKAMKAMSDTIGSKLLVVIIPDEMQVNERILRDIQSKYPDTSIDIHYPQKRIVNILKDEQIPFIDLLTTFETDASPSAYYQPRDTHFNSYGFARAAEIMYPVIRDMLSK